MIQIFAKISVILLLVILFYEDIRHRHISIHWIALTFLGILALSFLESKLNLINILLNIAFIAVQVIFIYLYLMFRGKNIKNIFQSYIGIGDIVFWIIPAFYLDPVLFVFYTLFCYLSVLLVYGIIMVVKKKNLTIPLAGFMAMVLGLYIAIEWCGANLGNWTNSLIIQ